MPYTHFWHGYVHQHATAASSQPDFVALLGIAACVVLLASWVRDRWLDSARRRRR